MFELVLTNDPLKSGGLDGSAEIIDQLLKLHLLLRADITKLDADFRVAIGPAQETKGLYACLAADLKVIVEAELAFGKVTVALQMVENVAAHHQSHAAGRDVIGRGIPWRSAG